ncbi:Uncharacterised protein [Escherichia coli]|nr:Uncharacterised protein [Escherichia coli]
MDGHHFLSQLWCTAAQDRLDAGKQFLGRKWFGQIVVRSRFQAFNTVAFGAVGGQHDDRNLTATFTEPERTEEVNAGTSR